jgi:hypothetical protein
VVTLPFLILVPVEFNAVLLTKVDVCPDVLYLRPEAAGSEQ